MTTTTRRTARRVSRSALYALLLAAFALGLAAALLGLVAAAVALLAVAWSAWGALASAGPVEAE